MAPEPLASVSPRWITTSELIHIIRKPNLIPESKTRPRIQKHFPESRSGMCFGFWDLFWILGNLFDSGMCFWILGSVLDSGMCFWILGCVFGFWEVFWILGWVFGFWDVFLDSGTCFGFWEVFCPYEPPYRIAVKAIFVVYFCPSSLVSRQISLPLTDLVSKQIYNCLFINLVVSSD